MLCHGEENEQGNNHFLAVLVKTQSFHNLKWSLLWGQPDSGIRPEWGVQEAVGALALSVKDLDRHVRRPGRGSFQVEIGRKGGGAELGWPSCRVQQRA